MSLTHFPRETVYTFQDLTLSEKFLHVNGEYLFSLYYLLDPFAAVLCPLPLNLSSFPSAGPQ